jgi:hypothetical protein
MSPQFTPLGGGIDNITEDTENHPTPKANELWAEIQTDGSGNPTGWILYASDGKGWYEV